MIVVIEPAGADVGYIEVGPAIIVVIGHNATRSPSIVLHAGARALIGERAVVIVVEEGRMR